MFHEAEDLNKKYDSPQKGTSTNSKPLLSPQMTPNAHCFASGKIADTTAMKELHCHVTKQIIQ